MRLADARGGRVMTIPRQGLRILIVGKDARTDAIADACLRSHLEPELFAVSSCRIPGLMEKCVHVELDRSGNLCDVEFIVRYARAVQPDLVIVGPEEPLAAGLVDRLEAELGVPCFGPPQALAQIESSKAWTRALLEKAGIAGNPAHRSFMAAAGIREYMSEIGQVVVKPDGLTGGKGVKVLGEHLSNLDEAYEYALQILQSDAHVVIEEKLDGEEFSLQSFCDGSSVVHCPPVQDHKRAYAGDTGPNTGGMGSYSDADLSLPFLRPDDLAAAQRITENVARAIAVETGRPYRGILYGGYMVTSNGIKLIEFNSRFGDPEAMNVLSLLKTDFVEICWAVAHDQLAELDVAFTRKATVCKYVVPEKYPSPGSDGEEISVPAEVLDDGRVRCFWAATQLADDEVTIHLTGSRALAVVGVGSTIAEAEEAAEWAASLVEGPVRHREDIGKAEVVQARVDHVARLRP